MKKSSSGTVMFLFRFYILLTQSSLGVLNAIEKINCFTKSEKRTMRTCAPSEGSEKPAHLQSDRIFTGLIFYNKGGHYENTPIQIYLEFYHQILR